MRRALVATFVALLALVPAVALAQPAPTVTVTPDTAWVGDPVVVEGQSLPVACSDPGARVRVMVGPALLGVVAADGAGGFTMRRPVPDLAPGAHDLAVSCQVGDATVPVELARTRLTVREGAPPTTTSTPVGDPVPSPPPTGVVPEPVVATPPPGGPRTGTGGGGTPPGGGGGGDGTPPTGTTPTTGTTGIDAPGQPGGTLTEPADPLTVELVGDAVDPVDDGIARLDGDAAAATSTDLVDGRWGPAGEIGRLTDPDVTVAGAAAAVVAVLVFSFLIGFPSTMFDGTFRSHYDEVVAVAARRLPRMHDGCVRLVAAVPSAPVLGMALAGGIVAAAADASLATDARSLAVIAAMVVAVGVAGWLGWYPTKLTSDGLGNAGRYRAYPVALLVAVGCVLLTRFGNLHPGYLYGLLFAYETRGHWTRRLDATTYAAGFGAVLGLGLVSWLGLSLTDGLAPDDGAAAGLAWVVADTVLAGLTIVGVQGVVFGMLPFRFTPGAAIWTWSPRLWWLTFTPALLALVVMLSTPQRTLLSVEATPADVPRAALAFLLFSAVSVGVWTLARVRADRLRRSRPAVLRIPPLGSGGAVEPSDAATDGPGEASTDALLRQRG